MPMSDDELKKVFREGRRDDVAHAPSFEKSWGAAMAERKARRVGVVALVAAAVIAIAAGWLVTRPSPTELVPDPAPEVAETNPLPDLPDDEAPEPAAQDAELMELANWEPNLDSPTDFLLEQDGVLNGGIPSSLDDSVFDPEDLTMEL